MTSFNECLLDFDINYLDLGATDLAEVKTYRRKQKGEFLSSIVNSLTFTKRRQQKAEYALFRAQEDIKKILIEFKNCIDQSYKLETDLKSSQNQNQNVETKLSCLQNQQEAYQAHIKQLQQLCKEWEIRFEKQNEQRQLDNMSRNSQVTKPKKKKKIPKKKRTPMVEAPTPELKKNYNNNNEHSLSGEQLENSGDVNTDIFDNLGRSPPLLNNFTENKNEQISTSLQHSGANKQKNMKTMFNEELHQCLAEDDIDRQSESSHDMVSIDTGRGSSLTISDKCIDSPDYVNNNSPLDSVIAICEPKTKHVSVSTSPLTVNTTVDRGSSPINFESINPLVSLNIMSKKSTVDVAVMTDLNIMRKSSTVDVAVMTDLNIMSKTSTVDVAVMTDLNIMSKTSTVDVAVMTDLNIMSKKRTVNVAVMTDKESPVKISRDVLTSPGKEKASRKVVTTPVKPLKDVSTSPTSKRSLNKQKDKHSEDQLKKQCLELNNSVNMSKDKGGDGEINMILRTMRFTHQLITPIPITPAPSNGSHEENSANADLSCSDDEINEKIKRISQEIVQKDTEATSKRLTRIEEALEELRKAVKRNEAPSDNIENICIRSSASEVSISCPENISHAQNNICADNTIPDIDHDIEATHEFTEEKDHHTSPSTKLDSITELENNVQQVSTENNTIPSTKRVKCKKLTRLEKFKKKMLPKSKIMKATKLPSKLLQIKLKPISQNILKNRGDSAASINDKSVYENAVRVMAELNTKQKAAKSPLDKEHTINAEGKNVKNQIKNDDKEIENTCIVTRSLKSREKEIILTPSAKIETRSRKSRESGEKEIVLSPSAKIETRSRKSRESGEKEIVLSPSAKIETRSRKSRESGEKEIVLSPSAKIETRSRKSRESGEKEIVLSPSAKIETRSRKSRESGEKQIVLSPFAKIGTRSRKSRESGEKEIILSPSAKIENRCRKSRESGEKEIILSPSAKIETRSRKSRESGEKEIILSASAKIETRSRKRESGEKEIILSPSAKIETRSRKRESGEKEIILSPSAKIETRSRKSRESGEMEIILSPTAKIENPYSRQSKTTKLNNNINGDIGDTSDCTQNDSKIEDIDAIKPRDQRETQTVKEKRKAIKRLSVEKIETPSKRILRSSTLQVNSLGVKAVIKKLDFGDGNIENRQNSTILQTTDNDAKIKTRSSKMMSPPAMSQSVNERRVDYADLDLFSDESQKNTRNNEIHSSLEQLNVKEKNPEDNILCTMLQKYFITSVKYPKKISDSVINNISTKIEGSLQKIIESPKKETKLGMDKFVEDVRHLNSKHFIAGLMKYLIEPTRKAELFNKVECRPAPPMTKSEQILIYVLSQLKTTWPGEDIIDNLLKNIEYTLFRINKTPEFNVIETVSHFYAVLCRYTQAKCRLRLFILDAMYCIQYKAIPLIKQCLDVWPHILPLAHMGIAKSPLVTSMVYLLHFFKCEDKFNRVNEIRRILSQRYFYIITEWTEPRILEMFKSSIKDMRDIYIEKKMLRLSLIILAKRHGPRWCQANIITMLQAMIENKNTPERIKVFCASMIGPLMKPYPVDMKIHCEIVINQLLDMLQNEPSLPMQEAIYSSLIFLSKHNQNKVIQVLLTWNPKQISPAMELSLKDYVREKPFKVWKGLLSKVNLN